MKWISIVISLLCIPAIISYGQSVPDTSKSVLLLSVERAITPTTTNYIRRGITEARKRKAECLLIQLDTPGGLLESTKNIVQSFLASDDVPIVVYVAPEGARAASAGTFITMAAHIAVMAPATTIGAASPVQTGGAEMDSVMKQKIFNYSESFIKSIANHRNRNAKWAQSAVRDGEAITSAEALERNVIDYIAQTRGELLSRIDGEVVAGDTLQTRRATITKLPTNLAENLLGFLIRREVMLILTMIAIYGIIGEVTNPGAIVPGVAGVIALILVLYASASMPINIAGFALIGLAVILFVAEAFTSTFGILIAGGAVSFFLGALMLFQDLPKPMELSWAWLIPATVVTTLFFIWIVTEGIRAQFSNNITGKESMIGKKAEVVEPVDQQRGRIFVNGEYWNAISEEPIPANESCEIVAIDGLTVTVKPLHKS